MKKIRLLSLIFLSLLFIQCSNDSDSPEATLFMNGLEYQLGTNTATTVLNAIKSNSENNLWLTISEKTQNPAQARAISIYASHETGPHSGTYILKNDAIGPGIALLAILDASGTQIAGGALNGPLGTITILDYGNNKFKITFTDVVLDPDTANETTISGYCIREFTTQQ